MFAIWGLHKNSIIWNNSIIDSEHEELLETVVVANAWENSKKYRERTTEITNAFQSVSNSTSKVWLLEEGNDDF